MNKKRIHVAHSTTGRVRLKVPHSGNNVDLKLLLAGGVVAATVLEIGATAATPVWVTLLLFGANHFVELHEQAGKRAKPADAR